MRYVILTLLTLCTIAFASEVRTKVQYVSATAVYLDAGRESGIAQGDTVLISRNDRELISLTISFVSDKSSSCELANAPTLVAKDDLAIVFVSAKPSSNVDSIAIEDTKAIESELHETTSTPSSRINQLSGRIGVEYTIQNDREPVNYDYTEPALSFRATLSKISGSDVSAKVNLRLRRTVRENDALSSSSNRIYEAMLAYEPDEQPISVGVGRLILRETRGMGYLDGAYVKYDVAHNWKIGAVGGIEPDLQNTRIQSDFTKIGVFAAFERRLTGSNSLQATASLAGSYLRDEISREFLYQQISYVGGSRFRLFESTEINLNRGWIKEAEGSYLTLAALLLDAHYNFSHSLGATIGYDNRTNYYTAETRSIPDSIFASTLQQGFRASLDSRFGKSYSAELGVGIRDGEGLTAKSTNGWLRFGSTSLFDSKTSAFVRLRWFDSDYSTGIQPALSLSRNMTKWLTTGVEVGANNYELSTNSEQVSQQWLAVMLDLNFAKQFYASAETEYSMGDGRETTLLNLSLGYRF